MSASAVNPVAGLNWKINSIEAKIEISRRLFIITPYIGAGVMFTWGGKAGYYVRADDIKMSGVPKPFQDFMEENDLIPDADDLGFSYEVEVPSTFVPRVFGGLSINLFIIKIDLTGLCSYSSKKFNYGVSVGARIQL